MVFPCAERVHIRDFKLLKNQAEGIMKITFKGKQVWVKQMREHGYLLLILTLQVVIFMSFNGLGVLGVDDIYTLDTTSRNISGVLHQAFYFSRLCMSW